LKVTPKSVRKEILTNIRKSLLELGSSTIVELSDRLGISFPTISKCFAQMEKAGELILVGLDDSNGGRRAKRYAYNPEYMLGLAIFLERTETHYIVYNCLGDVKNTGKTDGVLVEDDLTSLTKLMEKIVDQHPTIRSIAIGVPGSVDNGKIFYIPGYEQFHNLDLKGYFEQHFSIPVVVENDMNAAVLGFHKNSGLKNNPSLVYLYSGQNGPGAGFLINGDVVRGSTFFAGEVSFVPQYNDRNFRQALENDRDSMTANFSTDAQIDAICRLIATITAIINPHTIIFCSDEIEKTTLKKISIGSSKYIPSKHLPNLTISDWKQDYLYGLQSLGITLMLMEPN